MQRLVLSLVIILLLSCNTEQDRRKKLINSAEGFSIVVKDGLGDELKFPRPPKDLVVLTPDLAKIILYLDAKDKVIAVSELCKEFVDFQNKRIIQAFPSLDLDAIKQLQPECLLVSNFYYQDTMVKIIKAQGLNTFFYKVKTLDDFYKMFIETGKLLDKKKEANNFVDTFKTYIKKYSAETKHLTHYRVVFFTDLVKMKALKKEHFLAELLENAGAKVITSDGEMLVEELTELNPDFIFIPETQENIFYDLRSQHPEIDNLQAVINHNVIIYPPEEYLEATPLLLNTYLGLLRILHPKIEIR